MPLDPPNLDDRTFQDIVDEAKRLIPRFTPRVDQPQRVRPGRRADRAVRVDERDGALPRQPGAGPPVRALPQPGRHRAVPADASRAPNLTFWLSSPADRVVRIPEGTEVATALDDADATVFSTAERGRRQPADADRRAHVERRSTSRRPTSGTTCAAGPVGASASRRPRWPRATPCTSAPRSRSPGSRSGSTWPPTRRASASTPATRPWPGRCGTARRGCGPSSSPTAPAG